MVLFLVDRSALLSAQFVRGCDSSIELTGKPGLTMAAPPCLVPLGQLWVRRRDLQPLGFRFTCYLVCYYFCG